jgi:hypothetical protein
MKSNGASTAAKAWWTLGGLVALGAAYLIVREMPSMRRELRIIRM